MAINPLQRNLDLLTHFTPESQGLTLREGEGLQLSPEPSTTDAATTRQAIRYLQAGIEEVKSMPRGSIHATRIYTELRKLNTIRTKLLHIALDTDRDTLNALHGEILTCFSQVKQTELLQLAREDSPELFDDVLAYAVTAKITKLAQQAKTPLPKRFTHAAQPTGAGGGKFVQGTYHALFADIGCLRDEAVKRAVAEVRTTGMTITPGEDIVEQLEHLKEERSRALLPLQSYLKRLLGYSSKVHPLSIYSKGFTNIAYEKAAIALKEAGSDWVIDKDPDTITRILISEENPDLQDSIKELPTSYFTSILGEENTLLLAEHHEEISSVLDYHRWLEEAKQRTSFPDFLKEHSVDEDMPYKEDFCRFFGLERTPDESPYKFQQRINSTATQYKHDLQEKIDSLTPEQKADFFSRSIPNGVLEACSEHFELSEAERNKLSVWLQICHSAAKADIDENQAELDAELEELDPTLKPVIESLIAHEAAIIEEARKQREVHKEIFLKLHCEGRSADATALEEEYHQFQKLPEYAMLSERDRDILDYNISICCRLMRSDIDHSEFSKQFRNVIESNLKELYYQTKQSLGRLSTLLEPIHEIETTVSSARALPPEEKAHLRSIHALKETDPLSYVQQMGQYAYDEIMSDRANLFLTTPHLFAKPLWKEPGMPGSIITPEMLFAGIGPGESLIRETAAYRLQEILGWDCGVPPTLLLYSDDPTIIGPHTGSTDHLVSVQKLIPNCRSMISVDAATLDPREMDKFVLDVLGFNLDGHANNMLLTEDGHIVKIDHGLFLPHPSPEGKPPGEGLKNARFGWMCFPQAKSPMSPERKRQILKTNIEDVINRFQTEMSALASRFPSVKQLQIPPECMTLLKLNFLILKKGAELDKSFLEIGAFSVISRKVRDGKEHFIGGEIVDLYERCIVGKRPEEINWREIEDLVTEIYSRPMSGRLTSHGGFKSMVLSREEQAVIEEE